MCLIHSRDTIKCAVFVVSFRALHASLLSPHSPLSGRGNEAALSVVASRSGEWRVLLVISGGEAARDERGEDELTTEPRLWKSVSRFKCRCSIAAKAVHPFPSRAKNDVKDIMTVIHPLLP